MVYWDRKIHVIGLMKLIYLSSCIRIYIHKHMCVEGGVGVYIILGVASYGVLGQNDTRDRYDQKIVYIYIGLYTCV